MHYYKTNITFMLNTDIVYLAGTNGHDREWQPDCFCSTSPPANVGRNREKDQLLMQLHFQNGGVDKDEYSTLLELASQYYYGTAGSITAASRAAINTVNKQLLDRNRAGGFSPPLQAGLTCAVLRGDDLYVTQSGPGKIVVFRESNFEQFPDHSLSLRAVGMSDQTIAHYFHTVVAKGDLLWMSFYGSSEWDLTSLLHSKGDSIFSLASLRDLTGNNNPSMVCRFCDQSEQGQLAAALSAIEQVDSVSRPDLNNLHKSGSDNMIGYSNAPNWASDTLAAIDGKHHNSVEKSPNSMINTDNKVLSESFEQPESEIELFNDCQGSENRILTDPRPHSGISVKPMLESDVTNVNHDTQQKSSASDGLFTQSKTNSNEPAQSIVEADTGLLGLSSDLSKPVLIESEVNLDNRDHDGSSKDIVSALDVETETGWGSSKKWYMRLPLSTLQTRIEAKLDSTFRLWSSTTHKMMSRVLPDYDPDTQMSGSAILWCAAGVPVLVVILTIAVYVQFGRAREFNYYVDQARMEATLGRTAKDAIQAAPHWRQVLLWSSLANKVRSDHPDVEALESAAIGVLDVIDRVERVDVEVITLDGLQANAHISKILARGSSVYSLDVTNQSVNRAVLTTSGKYQLDPVFECKNGSVGTQIINSLVDIAWLDTPNVVGQDTLIALDPDGRLLYCTSDGTMAVTLLTAPYDGWNNPVALEVFQGRIYVMEPRANEIWVYTRDDKFFGQAPVRYFTESAIDLSDAIDISIVQGSIYILHEDGHMTECIRKSQDLPPECNLEMTYVDVRLGRSNDIRFKNISFPVSMAAYPPPYSSLYLTDLKSPGVFQFSLRLAYQREFRAVNQNSEIETIGFAVGPGRDLFFASEDNVYVGKRP